MKRAKTKNGLFERWEVYKSLKGWHYNIFNDLGVKMWFRPPKYYKTKIEAVKAAKKMFYVDGPAGRWSENPKKKTAAKKPRGRSSARAPRTKMRVSYALPSVLVELADAIDFELENGVTVSLKNFKLMSTVSGDRLFCLPVEHKGKQAAAADTGETKKARLLYSRFTAFKSDKKYTLGVQSKPWVFFGAASAISYRSDKWSGRPVDYIHKFDDQTECWADDADYKTARLFAFRGQIKITKRGIEG